MLKAFFRKHSECALDNRNAFGRIENIVIKGENAGHQNVFVRFLCRVLLKKKRDCSVNTE